MLSNNLKDAAISVLCMISPSYLNVVHSHFALITIYWA